VNQSTNSPRSIPAESWFVATENGAVEYGLDVLKQQIERGAVHSKSLVWRKGMPDWVQLDQVPLLRMLATVQPSPEICNAQTSFEASAAPVSGGLFDELFEDKTTVFAPPAEVAPEPTSAPAAQTPASAQGTPAESASPPSTVAPSTSIFDGLFNSSPEARAMGPNASNADGSANQVCTLDAVQNAAREPDHARRPTPVPTANQSEAAPLAANPPVKSGHQAQPRRNKPDSVSRKQKKSARAEPTRPTLSRPATPRVSIPGIVARTFEAKSNFQLAEHAPVFQGLARSVSANTAPTQPEKAASSAPIVLPLPMPPLPRPLAILQPEASMPQALVGREGVGVMVANTVAALARAQTNTVGPSETSQSRSNDEPKAKASVADAPARFDSGIDPHRAPVAKASVADVPAPLVGAIDPHRAPVAKASVADVPAPLVGAIGTHHPQSAGAVADGKVVHPEATAATRAPVIGDSLFPSTSSIHPALFRANGSRRGLMIVGSLALAAIVTFAVVLATTTPQIESNQPPSVAARQESAQQATPASPDTERARTNAARPAAELTGQLGAAPAVPVRNSPPTQQPHATAGEQHGNTARESGESKKGGLGVAASGPRRSKAVHSAGAMAIAKSEPPASGQPAVDQGDSWERGTIERRAWMEPGF
jgi:hypothetical protein